MNKNVIYTVISNHYDYLKDPECISPNCDYICFTDNPELKSNIWKIIYEDSSEELDKIRWQRRHKILAHQYLEKYELSIYVDGNIRIIGDLYDYFEKESRGGSILCLKHPYRNNVFDEAEECIALNKDLEERIRKQIEGYKNEGYPGNNGLIASGILVRRHMDSDVINLMNAWWNEVETKSLRDQLSFNYVCWKYNFKYDASALKCWKSPYWLNPGIHTDNIKDVENELIHYTEFIRFKEEQLRKKENAVIESKKELEECLIRLKQLQSLMEEKDEKILKQEQELSDIKETRLWNIYKILVHLN